MKLEHKKKKITIKDFEENILTRLELGEEIVLTVTGNSMAPMLKNKRDSVVIVKCDNKNLQVGDIPLYKREMGQYVMHRIIRVNESSYDICGDAYRVIEKGVPKDSIVAVVKRFSRNRKEYELNNFLYIIYSSIWCKKKKLFT